MGLKVAPSEMRSKPARRYWTKGRNPLPLNPEPPTPFTGPNPAGIVVGVRDSEYNVLAVTRGNPLGNAGKPSSEDNWASWSPPNPDWTVYADPFYPTRWVTGGEELVKVLKDIGFTVRTASDLRSWMLTVMGAGGASRTLVVMAQDVIPDTVVEAPNDKAILRYYLNAGGSVLWFGDAPFYTQGTADRRQVQWGETAQEAILAIPGPNTLWSNEGVLVVPESYAVGYGIGTGVWWPSSVQSHRAIPAYCWAQPLAMGSYGGMAMWRVSYWPLKPDCDNGESYVRAAQRENAPGFVRIFDSQINMFDAGYLTSLVSVVGQITGWYRGQVGE